VLPLAEIQRRGVPLEPGRVVWSALSKVGAKRRPRSDVLWPSVIERTSTLPAAKFKDPTTTAAGEPRAHVALEALATLWVNTGTLCNVTCRNCYIESSPRNDRLLYFRRHDLLAFLDEIERDRLGTQEIGFTGGEPFMNPDIIGMIDDCLIRGFRVLVLTNAMAPMMRRRPAIAELAARFGNKLGIRVSLDHYTAERHEDERGPDTFAPTMAGLRWLAGTGCRLSIAGRSMWGEDDAQARDGYAALLGGEGIAIDVTDPAVLVLFPEMDARADVPEITTACWSILGKSPADVMCASSRMLIKRKGAAQPAVVACTLLPYDAAFELGPTLRTASRAVALNHPHCARFCVLGGASCAPLTPDTTEADKASPAVLQLDSV
jgi:hypothetical protein